MCRSFEKLLAFIVCMKVVNVYGGTFRSMTINICVESNDNVVKFIDLSIAECVDACIRRQACKSIEYKRRMQFCQLHNKDVLLSNDNAESCIFIARNDMDTAQANKCQCSQAGHVCNLVSGQCEIKECNHVDLPYGQLYGNLKYVGNKLRVSCNKGYRERSGIKQVICNTTGEWDHTPTCELTMKEYYCQYLPDYPNYYLVDLHNDGFTTDRQTSIAFEVKGNNDAHILLQRERQDINYYVIEIVIGGWGNTRSAIRTARGQNSVSEYGGTVLDRNSYNSFWMSWSNGCVKVGRGSSADLNMLMEWCGLTFNITNMRISFGWGSDGYFKLPF